jgi:hypothetical protein
MSNMLTRKGTRTLSIATITNNVLICDTENNSVECHLECRVIYCNRYAECHYAECRGVLGPIL